MQHSNTDSCILLKFYIKPQLRRWRQCHYVVVSYWNSTSNHNSYPLYSYWVQVVSYWNSTSNHNFALNVSSPTVLYLIEILHQTTTIEDSFLFCYTLYLIEILHQTTTSLSPPSAFVSCILSKFYIKPQRPGLSATPCLRCILSKFYIKPQLTAGSTFSFEGCILSKFYIKPQQRIRHKIGHSCCILSKFYIKPQLFLSSKVLTYGCILSKFYIKPQLIPPSGKPSCVVSYRNSTSNHNSESVTRSAIPVVSYRNSTSNHNFARTFSRNDEVVSYRNSTSNHNPLLADRLTH